MLTDARGAVKPPTRQARQEKRFKCSTYGARQIDGHLTKHDWQCAPKSPRFVDVVSGSSALYETRAAPPEPSLYAFAYRYRACVRGRQVPMAREERV